MGLKGIKNDDSINFEYNLFGYSPSTTGVNIFLDDSLVDNKLFLAEINYLVIVDSFSNIYEIDYDFNGMVKIY
jgi:hypothetical protein